MVNRKRPISELSTLETVTSEPKLVGGGVFSHRQKVTTYAAVDYLGTRFRVGEHVAMYTGDGKEWVCVLETLYKDPKTAAAMFKGRWFWTLQDIKEHEGADAQVGRPSKCLSHELISCDNRDTNLIESISRKCDVLSFDNFQMVKKFIMKSDSPWKKTYYCERQYYYKARRFSELNSILFPGDPIPTELRRAAGLPDVSEEKVDYSNAYHERDFHSKAKKGAKMTKTLGRAMLLW